MDVLLTIAKVGVYVVMAVSVLAAFGAVSLPNIFHAALALIVTLVGVAGLFISMRADFLAVVQILLYVGAVMTLVIFSIMMTERMNDPSVPQRNNLFVPALVGCSAILMILIGVLYWTPWQYKEGAGLTSVTTHDLGVALLTTYVFPFEVISVFLIAALIGAIIVAKKDNPS